MNKAAVMAAVTAVAFLGSLPVQAEENPNAAEAKGIIKEFFTELKGELQAAIQDGGPASAISVCQRKAPAIAHRLSEESGWDVGRTSLKLRNAALNAPDAWEEQVLREFEARKQAGEDAAKMAHAEVVGTDEGERFRFMKAIPTGEVCLKCHGTEIDPAVAEAIDQAYPNDEARGYELGDIRGAFTLSKPL